MAAIAVTIDDSLNSSHMCFRLDCNNFVFCLLTDADELATIVRELNYRICVQSAKLLRHLKQKDRLLHKVQKNCDIVTACLQAVSQKRRKYCFVYVCISCE